MPNMRRHRKDIRVKKVHGIRVDEITHTRPGNGLPTWVKDKAEARGYGDALDPLSLYITDDDINAACDAVAQGDGSQCVMAQAGQRLGAEAVYFYRTTAWIDFGSGPILRFLTSKSIYRNVIEPFDSGDRAAITGGVYPLTPARRSKSLKRRREYSKTPRKQSFAQRRVISHTERISMAAQS
jgi:hypothetical protein